MKKISPKQRDNINRNKGIVALYTSGNYTTQQIADNYHITPKSVQRVVKLAGVIRTQAEANRVAAPLKNYSAHRIPPELRAKRKHLSHKKRYQMLTAHPYCTLCGRRPGDGIRLEVDHIDNNATNNEDNNLQVLCFQCNQGKSHLDRFGA